MADQELDNVPDQEEDIVFDCPVCGKSLAIDSEGAGLVITCPDCQTQVRVPEEEEEIVVELESMDDALRQIEDLSVELAEVNRRREVLEHLRVNTLRRMEKVSDELAVIQAALDRITAHFEDAASDETPEEPE